MQKHFNTDFSVKTPDTLPTLSTGGIEQYYPYTLESAGRADFYPDWTSTIAPKRKKVNRLDVLKKNLEASLEQLRAETTQESTTEETAA